MRLPQRKTEWQNWSVPAWIPCPRRISSRWAAYLEDFDGSGLGRVCLGRGDGVQQANELFYRANGEAVKRVRHDIGIAAAGQMEPHSDAARIRVRIGIGNVGNSRCVREANRDWYRIVKMGRPAHRRRSRGRCECAFTEHALGVSGAETGMRTEQSIERIDGGFEKLLLTRGRCGRRCSHEGLLFSGSASAWSGSLLTGDRTTYAET